MFKRCAQYHFIAQALSARSDKLIPQRRDKSQFVSPAGLAAALLWLFWPWLWKWRTESSCPGVWGQGGVWCGCITINEHQFINQFLSKFGFLLLFLCVAVTPRSRAGLGQKIGPGILRREPGHQVLMEWRLWMTTNFCPCIILCSTWWKPEASLV